MDITRLPIGDEAGEDTDCIKIRMREDGRYLLECSALNNAPGHEAESVAVIGSEPYDSYADAEAAGIAWAGEREVERLYVSRVD